MKAHTAGPWIERTRAIVENAGQPEEVIEIGQAATDQTIAYVPFTPGGAEVAAGAEADARLIIAAPELLDMLWLFIDHMESAVDYGMPHTDEDNSDHENMRDALALWEKATGTAHLCRCRYCREERAAPPPPPCPVAEINRGGIGPGITAERRCSLPEGHEGDHAYGSWVRV